MIERWYKINVEMLRRIFGRVSYDEHGFTWILIHRFNLPPFFNKTHSSLLITTPGSNINNSADYNFYIDKNLKRNDIAASRYIFEDTNYNLLRHKNYARICFELKKFRPISDVIGGDTIVDLCQSIYNFLARRKR
ncbi:hypothetical protein ACFL6B_03805 [Thermodesulfobacteriota bacterium]